jgi:hypothetical protein
MGGMLQLSPTPWWRFIPSPSIRAFMMFGNFNLFSPGFNYSVGPVIIDLFTQITIRKIKNINYYRGQWHYLALSTLGLIIQII